MKTRMDEDIPPRDWNWKRPDRWNWRRFEQERRSVFTNASTALILVGPLALVLSQPEHVRPMFWVYITLAGLSQCLGLGTALTAYKSGELSVVAPLGTLRPLMVVPFTTVILGQRYTTWTTVGIVVVIMGAAVLEYEPGESIWTSIKRLAHNPSALIYLLAGVFWAPFPYLFKASTLSVTGGSPFFVSVWLLLTMAALTVPIRRYSWRILWRAFKERPVLDPSVPRRAHQRFLASRSLPTLYAIGAVIMTLQQYVEVTSYRIGPNTVAVLAIFKLSVPLVMVWERVFPKEPKPGDDKSTPILKGVFWQRLVTSAFMVVGAFLAGG